MTAWQADFKDVSSVGAEPEGKRQHVVETLNLVDSGTSVLLDAQVRARTLWLKWPCKLSSSHCSSTAVR